MSSSCARYSGTCLAALALVAACGLTAPAGGDAARPSNEQSIWLRLGERTEIDRLVTPPVLALALEEHPIDQFERPVLATLLQYHAERVAEALARFDERIGCTKDDGQPWWSATVSDPARRTQARLALDRLHRDQDEAFDGLVREVAIFLGWAPDAREASDLRQRLTIRLGQERARGVAPTSRCTVGESVCIGDLFEDFVRTTSRMGSEEVALRLDTLVPSVRARLVQQDERLAVAFDRLRQAQRAFLRSRLDKHGNDQWARERAWNDRWRAIAAIAAVQHESADLVSIACQAATGDPSVAEQWRHTFVATAHPAVVAATSSVDAVAGWIESMQAIPADARDARQSILRRFARERAAIEWRLAGDRVRWMASTGSAADAAELRDELAPLQRRLNQIEASTVRRLLDLVQGPELRTAGASFLEGVLGSSAEAVVPPLMMAGSDGSDAVR